jgi:drug/metabolite transporter (DMT)-like permease
MFDLVLLGALWGASFLFMRWGAADFGAVPLAAVRVALAAAVLLPLLAWRGQAQALRAHLRPIAWVGVFNSALPFAAFAFAALHITAGLSAVLNATAPLWGMVVAWAWLGDKPTRWRLLGLALGMAGVAWLVWDKAGIKAGVGLSGAALAVAACLGATLLYGLSASYIKLHLTRVPTLAVATGSQLSAAAALALPAWWLWPAQNPSARAWGAVALLGLLSTALAYLLYFRLVQRVDPMKAISVTFLIPLFAALWGGLFLGEAVTSVMAGAGGVILLGTALSTGLLAPFKRRLQASG